MSKQRYYGIDVIKILMTILIFLHHYQGLTGASFNGIKFYGGRFYFGYLVEMFFIISGFFTYNDNIENFHEYIINKTSRLLPIAFITSLFYALLLRIKFGSTHLWGIIISSTGLYSLLGESSQQYAINQPVWYVSSLLICYVVYFIIKKLSKRDNIPEQYLFFTASIIGLVFLVYNLDFPFFNSRLCRGYESFFVGVLLKYYKVQYSFSYKLIKIALIIVLFFIIIILFDYSFISYDTDKIFVYFFYPSIIIIAQSDVLSKLANTRPTIFFSRISYGVYLWHTPIIMLFKYINDGNMIGLSFNSLFVAAFILSAIIVVSTLSYYCLELPLKQIFVKLCNIVSD